MSPSFDPYIMSLGEERDEFIDEGGNMSQSKSEELLYQQLLGAYHSFPPTNGYTDVTNQRELWNQLNSVLDELIGLGHKNYEKFRALPRVSFYQGTQQNVVNIASLKMQMMSTLRTMGTEFQCGDPGYDLSRYGATNSLNVQQTSSPSSTANAHQVQPQHQETTLTLEQHIEKLQKIVREELTDEQTAEISEPLINSWKIPTSGKMHKS